MKKAIQTTVWALKIITGSCLFSLGFTLFLLPNDLNSGGISGLAMIVCRLLGIGGVGIVTAVINLPLFVAGHFKIGREFFIGSLIGMVASSAAIEVFAAVLPVPQVEPLLAVLYGGVLCGAGIGIVFAVGASTGGSDIIVRLLKMKWQHVPIGTINIIFDLTVAILTGIVFGDMSRALYSGVAIFVCGKVIDAVVYRFDYSITALIITNQNEQVVKGITEKLGRGATYLYGQGSYSGHDMKIVLTAVKKQQLAELKQLVSVIDPNAFIIVQEAHQVLGDGFSSNSDQSL